MIHPDPRGALRLRQREVFLATAYFVAPVLEAQRRLTGFPAGRISDQLVTAAHPDHPSSGDSPSPAESRKPEPKRRRPQDEAEDDGAPTPEITQPHHWSGTPPPAMPDGTPWP